LAQGIALGFGGAAALVAFGSGQGKLGGQLAGGLQGGQQGALRLGSHAVFLVRGRWGDQGIGASALR
jgi:hypothetical protein